MPNWCSNDLTLTHEDPAMIERAVKAFQSGKLLEEFIPIPDELRNPETGSYGGDNAAEKDALREELRAKYGYTGWYDFCVAEWGTKWDVGGEGYSVDQVDPNTIKLSFESAWSPPTTAYSALANLGFGVKAYYWESGMAFCGMYVADEDGEFDDYREYTDANSETVRDMIGEELDDYWGISESLAEWEEEQ